MRDTPSLKILVSAIDLKSLPLINTLKFFISTLGIYPAGKYWSPGRPEDVPLQRPRGVLKDPI